MWRPTESAQVDACMKYDINNLAREYSSRIYGLALSITHNEKDAEDVLQNTLIKLFRKINTFRNKSSISTWIYRIAYNESLMYLRARRRSINPLNTAESSQIKDISGLVVNRSRLPDEELLDTEFSERLDNAIKNIPIKYRMPLLLHKIHGLSLKECISILHIKTASLKTRLHRAYLMVKEELDRYFKDKAVKEDAGSMDGRCGIWQSFVRDFTSGRLNKQDSSLFKKHMTNCINCRSFLNSYKQAIRITGSLECRDIPLELRERIESFLIRNNP